MRKSTSSFGGSSSGSTNYVSDDCEYQNSAYKGAVAGATTALEAVAGVACGGGIGFESPVTSACLATSVFASIGSSFSDSLDSQNICTDYTMLALSDISDKITEMQVQLSELATAISEATLTNLYGDEIISLARASDLYVRCKDSSGCGNLDLDMENCQIWLRLESSINEAHKQAYFLPSKTKFAADSRGVCFAKSAIIS